MLVLVATKDGQRFRSKDKFECSEGEIVRFGLLQDHHNRTGRDNTMRGITSNGETTTVKVVDLKIDEEFYYELIKNCIEDEYGSMVNKMGIFIIETGSMKQKFNLKEIVVNLLQTASKREKNVVYRIDGRTLLRDISLPEPVIRKTRSKRMVNNEKEETNPGE